MPETQSVSPSPTPPIEGAHPHPHRHDCPPVGWSGWRMETYGYHVTSLYIDMIINIITFKEEVVVGIDFVYRACGFWMVFCFFSPSVLVSLRAHVCVEWVDLWCEIMVLKKV